MSAPALALPHGAPFTVDDLFGLPDDGNRYEVLGGSLVVSPAPTPKHQLVADRLCRVLLRLLPDQGEVVTASAIRMRNGDGPVPDVSVTTASPLDHPNGLPSATVHTVVEVVSPSNALNDRAYKKEIYAEEGIPCYWRVEIEPWRGHRGPLPLIVVRLLLGDGWQEIEAAAGEVAELPFAVGRRADGSAEVVPVKLDPAVLVGRERL